MASMSRILYFCPDFPQPSGGIKTLYRHVHGLVELGFDARIVHQKHPFRVTWHGYEAPTLWLSERPSFTPEDILVIPEVMPQVMQQTARFSGERIVIALSWSPTYWNLPPGQTWPGFGIRRVITKSPLIQDYLHWSMGIDATLIHEYVTPDRYYFDQGAKRPKICYLTRKERSAAWLHQVLLAKGDPFTRFEWMPLRELSEDEYARNLREATVYVTTNMQEGMNTSVLEAMACGCLIVGYNGVGGSVYMEAEGPAQNCILVENGNVPALGRKLETVLRSLAGDPDAYARITEKGLETARAYDDPSDEAESLRAVFAPLVEAGG
ncbi:MAG: glycosyltransferase [Caldilineaceae bacterium]|nr:glycosyltransferase [Caldilineaceae bacterium]MDE0337144.1 glycosyltransferase [Caldilineaceae bacterium]